MIKKVAEVEIARLIIGSLHLRLNGLPIFT
jgi:hypothetical protein